ncbi:hypothetical protein [Amycolatopsis sp. YIM 10]|uniref:hypothetical protein n=1 Tax=Amycolatopsis sp. YIM 10 TaxID=2653857 RepID=UPI0012905DD3|nr:hypothetical protein [Amycolatopsis sp. YIM 10]QFU87211.1 hypothetical protein YIM_10025 [Amycolatopsis sp. YIM 10]
MTRREVELAAQRVREASARLTATLVETRRDLETAKAELEREKAEAKADDRFAERARSGRAGRDMQRIQELVDRGRLGWDDVLLGRGEEWMTNAVRRSMGQLKNAIERGGLDEADAWATRADDDEYFDDPLGASSAG